jgi:hypothetical protein
VKNLLDEGQIRANLPWEGGSGRGDEEERGARRGGRGKRGRGKGAGRGGRGKGDEERGRGKGDVERGARRGGRGEGEEERGMRKGKAKPKKIFELTKNNNTNIFTPYHIDEL